MYKKYFLFSEISPFKISRNELKLFLSIFEITKGKK